MKKTGLKGYLYNFSVNYNALAVSDILNIHKYDILDIYKYKKKKKDEKEWNSIKMFGFVKRIFISTMIFFGCNLLNINPVEYI